MKNKLEQPQAEMLEVGPGTWAVIGTKTYYVGQDKQAAGVILKLVNQRNGGSPTDTLSSAEEQEETRRCLWQILNHSQDVYDYLLSQMGESFINRASLLSQPKSNLQDSASPKQESE